MPGKDSFAPEERASMTMYNMGCWRISSSQEEQGVKVKTRMSHVHSCTDDNGPSQH